MAVAKWLRQRCKLNAVDETPALLERRQRKEDNGVDITARLPDGTLLNVQCKVGQRPNVWRALEEVRGEDLSIAVVERSAGKGRPKPMRAVLMSAETFEALVGG